MKQCISCNKVKTISRFYSQVGAKDNLRSYCKDCVKSYNKQYSLKNKKYISKCMKEYYKKHKQIIIEKHKTFKVKHPKIASKRLRITHLKLAYNLTLKQYKSLLKSQNNVCAICKQKETSINFRGKLRNLSVDHSHKNGKIRGLLCNKCNHGLGLFNDNPNFLKKALQYLNKNK
jgi:hypothetical protein